MRSRNGNCPFIFSSIAVICTLTFGADNYYIGYRLSAKNTQPVQETLSLSKAMTPCSTTKRGELSLSRLENETLESLLQRERTPFLQFAASQNFRVKSNETLTQNHIQSLQTLTLPTQCYAVEFNDRSVTITLLLEHNE